jgi:hypothetical protein
MNNPFWEYSLSHYVREGVADACLALQDGHGLDVNMLLYGAWLGSMGQPPCSRVTCRRWKRKSDSGANGSSCHCEPFAGNGAITRRSRSCVSGSRRWSWKRNTGSRIV